jgi:hypothetical protein
LSVEITVEKLFRAVETKLAQGIPEEAVGLLK